METDRNSGETGGDDGLGGRRRLRGVGQKTGPSTAAQVVVEPSSAFMSNDDRGNAGSGDSGNAGSDSEFGAFTV